MLFSVMQVFSSEATITDVDSSVVTSLHITVDVDTNTSEIITPEVDGTTLISTTDTGGARIIEYSGDQSMEMYLDILQGIQYTNTADEPTSGTVVLLVQVFTLNATSGGQAGSNIAQATIDILPVNDNDPVFSEPAYTAMVSEAASVGETVLRVVATDADLYGSGGITYEIEGSSEEFEINSITGVIATARNLDAENTSSYELVVIASDNYRDSPRSSAASVFILVTDINDHPPVFSSSQYFGSVRENAAGGYTVVSITATDNDITSANNDITYELLTNEIGSGSGAGDLTPLPPHQTTPLPFTIDSMTGEISVAEGAEIDFETVTEYSLEVLATDSGEPPLTASADVLISVVNLNDEPPIFTQNQYTGSVSDDSIAGTFILTVSATDADSVGIAYSITGSEYLDIDSFTGEVTLKMPVDFIGTPSLMATVIANDTGSPPLIGEAEIVINVVNVNNNPPIFSQDSYTFSASEGTMLETVVNATDADEDTITYLITEGDEGTFSLDAVTGVLTTVSTLDYETQSVYQLTVAATDDLFTSHAIITIEVEDINDNPPVFTSSQYSASIPESLSLGSYITQVSAVDADTGTNAAIIYSITGSGEIFTIEQDTGIIRIDEEVDFESDSGPFLVQVAATNTEPPFFNTSATVVILVSDSNDNHPILSLDTLSYDYFEGSPPLHIASSITITDADSSSHLLASCEVTLERGECLLESSELRETCGDCDSTCGEVVAVTDTPTSIESTIQVHPTGQVVRFSGDLSEIDYQSLLSTLTYVSLAPEPAPGRRSVFVQCHDRNHSSNILELSLNLIPVNDNPITIVTDSRRLTLREGDPPLLVASGDSVVLTDRDFNPQVSWLRVTLVGARDPDRESLSLEDGVQSGLDITVNQTNPLEIYQVFCPAYT